MKDKKSFLKELFNNDRFLITPLLGDASSRQYFRVTYQESSFILCQDVDRDCFNRFIDAARWFARQKISVPEIIKVEPNSMLVLQSDLGDCSLSTYKEQQEGQIDVLKSVIQLMQQIHRTQIDKDIFLFKWKFDLSKLQDEFVMMKTYFWEGYLKQQWIDNYFIFYQQIHDLFLKIPYVLVHRDFHSRNIHILENRLHMIDFQDARLGPLPYDLVSYVEDPYCPLSEQEKVVAKNNFITQWDTEISSEQFLFWYDIVAVQRLFKILGSFTYLFTEKGKDQYLQYIPLTIKNLILVLHRIKSKVEGADLVVSILEREKK